MEVKKPTRQPRSFFRRSVLPVSLAFAVIASGGWGVYHFLYNGPDVSKDIADLEKAHSAPEDSNTATNQLKNLFASTAEKEAAPIAKEAADVKSDRYSLTATTSTPAFDSAPQLPPAAATAEVAGVQTPVVPSPLGNRYAAAPLPEVAAPAVVEEVLEQKTETLIATSEDITRGQEPEGNPLRASSQPTASAGEFDTRAAFTDAPGIAQPTSPVPTLAAAPPVGSSPIAANPFPGQSKKIAPQPPQNNLAQGRYGDADSKYQAAEPTTSDFATGGASVASRQPAPAFGIESATPIPIQPSAGTATTPQVAQVEPGLSGLTPTPGITNQPGRGRPGEKMLEGLQSASISIQKLAPPEIQVGKRCTFAIRVRNTGQRTAQNVRVLDEIPLGTELVGTAPHATVSGSQLTWDLGSLSVGEERLVEMELKPTEEREIGSVATVTLAAQASAKARCTRPQLALRLTTKPQVLVGQQHLVQIEVSNPGSGAATGVMLLETIPTGVSHEAGPALEFEVGTLQAGESRRMELLLTAEQAGMVSNVMTAKADANLRVEANCEFEVLAPELKVTVEGPQRRYLERPATYRVSINNPGTATAKDIHLTTKLPKGLQFVGADNLGEYDPATHTVEWSLAELPANERGVVELTALPIEAGELMLEISTSGHQGLEDRTEKRVVVEGITALTFEVVDVESLIEVGGKTTYQIVVANQGSKAATNVQVVAVMPAGMRALSGQGDSQHTIQGNRIIFSPLAQLAPKGEASYQIEAQGTRPGDQRVRVMIQSDEVPQPITKEVSTRVYADE